MPDVVTHPTLQELAAYGLGKLPERAAAPVAAHLEECAACRQAVADLPPDSFLAKVHAARPLAEATPLPGRAAGPVAAAAAPDVPPELAQHPRYHILRELGRGGMGVVYQARQTVMDRQVVIKVINGSLLDRPNALERFRREVRAAARLAHPNIVAAYDAEQAGNLHLLVMEFVPGQSLAEVLQKKGPLPVAQACGYIRQAALGLQHAHERGMVHRDLKPANLMLTPQGQVKILDFGLAKLVSEHGSGKGLTASNAYMGTPEYSAPEQATNARTADIRADLYSLGCTLYCLLAGRPPFQEETAVLTILAHLEKKPVPLPELHPDVPAGLWAVVARLLAKDPARRYQTPADVARALAPFARAAAKPAGVPSPERVRRTARDGGRPPGGSPAHSTAPARGTLPVAIPAAEAPPGEPARPSGQAPRGRRGCLIQIKVMVAFGAILLLVGAALLGGVMFSVRTPHGVVLLEVDQPDAEVFLDGRKLTVKVPGDQEEIRIELPDGKEHELKVTKGGFETVTRQVTFRTGKSERVIVKLVPAAAAGVRPEAPAPGPAQPPPAGQVATEERKVADFTAVDVGGAVRVVIRQGDNFRVAVTADANLLPFIKTTRGGSALSIRMANGSFSTINPLEVEVTMPVLEEVRLSGASRATVEGFRAGKEFRARLSETSILEGEVQADKVDIDASGASRANLRGSGKDLQLTARGACRLELPEFAADRATVDLRDACRAEVQVKAHLDYSLSGVSHLDYRGSPALGSHATAGAASASRVPGALDKPAPEPMPAAAQPAPAPPAGNGPVPGGRSNVQTRTGDREVRASLDGAGSISSRDGVTVIRFAAGTLRIEKGTVQLDEKELARLTEGTKTVEVDYTGGKLTITADGKPVVSKEIRPPE